MLRAPSRSPLVQLIARLLIVALVAAAIPTDTIASLPVGEASKLTKSAFGELLAHTGSDPQPYAFTGEPYDPNLGFQYHRARWMDPRVGRFVGMDPLGPAAFEPGTIHRYAYARANPVDTSDPTGFFTTMATLSAGLSMMNTINAISRPSMGGTLSAISDSVSLYVRSFAPWRTFGGGFHGDDRSFTTVHDGSVTSRITGIVKVLLFPTPKVIGRTAYSDISIHGSGTPSRGLPRITADIAGGNLEVRMAGSIPLIPGAPDIDVKLDAAIRVTASEVCYQGRLFGDAFPNAEVFVVSQTNPGTMLHTFATAGGQVTGPSQLLPGDNDRPMGGFASCVQR